MCREKRVGQPGQVRPETGRSGDGQGRGAFMNQGGLEQQKGQTAHMVAVQVRDKDQRNLVQLADARAFGRRHRRDAEVD